jgi:hypothetical protein
MSWRRSASKANAPMKAFFGRLGLAIMRKS